ncbi:MAG: tetratricopeptide repeat protein [Ignavibacteria bacterium]|nr:tetratricopeptide repeat protein [Ignavibacteria bacterium]
MTNEELQELLSQANSTKKKGKFADTESIARQVVDLITDENDPLVRVRALCLVSQSLWQRGRAMDALPSATEALACASLTDNKQEQALVIANMGIVQTRISNYPLALEYFQKALSHFEEIGDALNIARTYGNIAVVYKDLSEYHRALEYYRRAYALFEENGDTLGMTNMTTNIGTTYSYLSDYPNALECFNKVLAVYQEEGNKSSIAVVLGNIGNVNRKLGDYARALEFYGKSIALFEELDIKHGVGIFTVNTANVYSQLSDYERALEYYSKVLAIYEEIGDHSGIALIIGDMALVYYDLADYPRALEYNLKALEHHEKFGEKESSARMIGNIGLIYMKQADYEHSLEYLTKAHTLRKEIDDKVGAARVLGNIGAVYHLQGDYPRALIAMSEALEELEHAGSKSQVAELTGHIGSVYATKTFIEYDAIKAEQYLLTAIDLYIELGIKKMLYDNYKILSMLYEQERRLGVALDYYKKYHDIEREVQSEESLKSAQAMDIRRKAEEAERDRQIKLARFQEQEKILHNILPAQIAERMVQGEKTIADSYENVSVFFSDIVGFTELAQQVSAEELVVMLNGIFSQFDMLARKHGLEKIKTIGDSYMAVAGAPTWYENHAERAAFFALDVAELMKNYRTASGERMEMRFGVHSGSIVAGVIGENKFAYDLWGDAVNTASRMESQGEAGKIHVSEEFLKKLLMVNGEWLIDDAEDFPSLTINNLPLTINELPLTIIPRGEIDIKGKGMMKTYFLEKI